MAPFKLNTGARCDAERPSIPCDPRCIICRDAKVAADGVSSNLLSTQDAAVFAWIVGATWIIAYISKSGLREDPSHPGAGLFGIMLPACPNCQARLMQILRAQGANPEVAMPIPTPNPANSN